MANHRDSLAAPEGAPNTTVVTSTIIIPYGAYRHLFFIILDANNMPTGNNQKQNAEGALVVRWVPGLCQYNDTRAG